MIYILADNTPSYKEANAQPTVIYRNLMAEGTITNSTLPTTAPRANAVSEGTFDYWLPASVPDTLQCTFGGAQTADGCLIAGHTLGSAGATVNVQYYNGSSWVTLVSATPTDNDPILLLWPARSATGWGIQITTAVAQISALMIGPRLGIPGGIVPGYTPQWASRVITKYPGVSRRGQYFGQRVERAGLSMSASFMPIEYSYALTTMAGFRKHYDDGKAFAWASAPSVFGEDCAYVWAPEGAVIRMPVLAGGQLVNLSIDMEGYAEP